MIRMSKLLDRINDIPSTYNSKLLAIQRYFSDLFIGINIKAFPHYQLEIIIEVALMFLLDVT